MITPAATAAEIGGYTFIDPALLQAALTHPSSLTKKRTVGVPYERLEFLGDRVLGMAIAEQLYHTFPDATEGELARRQAALVQRDTLAQLAQSLGLLDRMTLATGDRENTRGHLTILGDAMEALFGALYLDSDYDTAAAFIVRHFASLLDTQALTQSEAPSDPKTQLQERVQGAGQPLPTYAVTAQSGPSHAPRFIVTVTAAGQSASAEGRSKQEAEKAAATYLLERLTQ